MSTLTIALVMRVWVWVWASGLSSGGWIVSGGLPFSFCLHVNLLFYSIRYGTHRFPTSHTNQPTRHTSPSLWLGYECELVIVLNGGFGNGSGSGEGINAAGLGPVPISLVDREVDCWWVCC
jgi:hypothetical protein